MTTQESNGLHDGKYTYDFVCEGCRCEGDLGVPTDQTLPFGCPEGCGATYLQWVDQGKAKLSCVVCPFFEEEEFQA